MPTGPKGQKRPADVIGAAVRVMRIATGEGRRRLGRANGKYSYLARSPAHPAERFPIIPDSRTHESSAWNSKPRARWKRSREPFPDR